MTSRRRTVTFAVAFAIWTLIGLSYTFAMVGNARTRGQPMTWSAALGWNLPGCYLWMLLSPIVIAIARRIGFEARAWKRALAVHIPAALGLALVHHVVFLTAYWWLGSALVTKGEALSLTISLPWRLHDALVIYALFLLALYVLHHARHRQQLASELSRAQLVALRTQLQPHFLFNTLNAVSALVVEDPPQAKAMIAKLGDFLRLTLDEPDGLAAPLGRELRLIAGYFELQHMRFRDRLTVKIDARDDVLARAVPHMLLQPLVENAFRHGIARRSGPSFVGVRGSRHGDALVLEVEDDGAGLPEVVAEGVGLRNTRARLRAYYGDTATLELCGRDGGGTLATIRVPWAVA